METHERSVSEGISVSAQIRLESLAVARLRFALPTALLLAMAFVLLAARGVQAQSAPVSPDHPWHGPGEKTIEAEVRRLSDSRLSIDAAKTYTLAELVDLAESHNPETRVAWERARAQAAAFGVARSELYPTLAAAALSGVTRSEAFLVDRFYRQTLGDFQVALGS